MKKYIKYAIIVIIVIILCIIIAITNMNRKKEEKGNDKFKIVTSFYPIYIMASNITQGANNIELVNMADTNIGCIHGYTLNAQDMKKIENANVFIQNGLGLESFIDKVTNSNKSLQVIDSSVGIMNLIKEDDETNSHIWTSISNYIAQVKNISEELIKKNTENADVYRKNTDEYVKKLTDLKLRYDTELQNLNGKGTIVLNEAFEYLVRDIKMNETTIHTDHEESIMSAEVLKNTIDYIKSNDIKIIIIDINDNIENAQTIANETGAKIYKLDSNMSGSMNKDSYIKSMTGNLEILKEAANS